jgi:hypothetical protein
MIRFLLLTLFAGAIALAAGCGGGGKDVEVEDRQAFVADALAAMADAKSYRIDLAVPSEGEPPAWTFDYVAPDSYRVLLSVGQVEGTTPGQECYVLPGNETSGGCEDSGAEAVDTSVYESLYVGDKLYARQCERVDSGCGDWETHDRPPVLIAGPSPTFLPGWPLVALQLAQIDSLGTDDDDLVLRGTVNHLRAIFENQRRVLTAAGITSFGSECHDVSEIPVAPDGTGPAPPGSRECHELTYDESLAQQEPDLSFFDETPAQIEVTIARDTSLVRRIVLHAEAPPDHEEGVELVIEYSDFNEVQIEAPE